MDDAARDIKKGLGLIDDNGNEVRRQPTKAVGPLYDVDNLLEGVSERHVPELLVLPEPADPNQLELGLRFP